jgi:hypothetical protein
MSAGATDYQVRKKNSGWIEEIQTADGSVVLVDAESPLYCKFVNWAARQPEAIARSYEALSKDGLYTCELSDVEAFLRGTSTILSLQGEPPALLSSRRIELRHEMTVDGREIPGPVATFVRLHIANPIHGPWSQQLPDGLIESESPLYVSPNLFKKVNWLLGDELSPVRCLSSWPVNRTFVYFDVSEFSRHPAGHQVFILNAITSTINKHELWTNSACGSALADLEAALCIGDGYIFVFKDARHAAFFAGYLAVLIEQRIARGMLIEFHFRIGVHTGPVFRFWDQIGRQIGKWNYVGRGITDAQRVLSAIGAEKDDVVFLSAETRRNIMAYGLPHDHVHQVSRWLQNRGRHKDKHNESRRLYELDHMGCIGAVAGTSNVS